MTYQESISEGRVNCLVDREHYFTAFDGMAGAAYNEVSPDGILRPFTIGIAGQPEFRTMFCVIVLRGGHVFTGDSIAMPWEPNDITTQKQKARQSAINKAMKTMAGDEQRKDL